MNHHQIFHAPLMNDKNKEVKKIEKIMGFFMFV